jgi:hypothetical protein
MSWRVAKQDSPLKEEFFLFSSFGQEDLEMRNPLVQVLWEPACFLQMTE